MTNLHNTAQPVLTDKEIREIQGTHLNTIGSIDKQVASVIVAGRAVESALLSKLRAPVAERQYHYRMPNCTPGRHACRTGNGYPDCPCWHDVGTGPLKGNEDTATHWRDKPAGDSVTTPVADRSGLLPCPFCGASAFTTYKTDDDEMRRHSVHCTGLDCEAQTRDRHFSEAEATAAWNRRAALARAPVGDSATPTNADLDAAFNKAVGASVAMEASAPVAGEALGYVAEAALKTNFDDPDARIDLFKTDLGLLGYYHTATPVAVYAAPQASAVAGEALDTLSIILEWDDGKSDDIEVHGTEKMLRRLQVWLDRKRGLFHDAAPQASAEDDRELRAAAQAFYDASKTVARFAVESLDDRDALVAASVRLRAALSATQPEQGFTECIFDGHAPEGYTSWHAWCTTPVKSGAFIRAARVDDWAKNPTGEDAKP